MRHASLSKGLKPILQFTSHLRYHEFCMPPNRRCITLFWNDSIEFRTHRRKLAVTLIQSMSKFHMNVRNKIWNFIFLLFETRNFVTFFLFIFSLKEFIYCSLTNMQNKFRPRTLSVRAQQKLQIPLGILNALLITVSNNCSVKIELLN